MLAQKIYVLGDSLSDWGNMRKKVLFRPSARTDKSGRFSDGRNWLDYFWEGIVGPNYGPYDGRGGRTWTNSEDYIQGTHGCLKNSYNEHTPVGLMNVAVGGALASGSTSGQGWSPKSLLVTKAILSNFTSQRATLLDRLYRRRSPLGSMPGSVLVVVWFGANDIITAPRDEEGARTVARELVDGAAELVGQICEAEEEHNPKGQLVRCVIGNVPDVNAMPRFFNAKKELQASFDKSRIAFNDELLDAIAAGRLGPANNRLIGNPYNYLDVADIEQTSFLQMDYLSLRGVVPVKSPGGLSTTARRGIRIRDIPSDLLPRDLGRSADIAESLHYATTSDGLHPTDYMYSQICDAWREAISGLGTIQLPN